MQSIRGSHNNDILTVCTFDKKIKQFSFVEKEVNLPLKRTQKNVIFKSRRKCKRHYYCQKIALIFVRDRYDIFKFLIIRFNGLLTYSFMIKKSKHIFFYLQNKNIVTNFNCFAIVTQRHLLLTLAYHKIKKYSLQKLWLIFATV